jgi:arylsulfate sulfotransferase
MTIQQVWEYGRERGAATFSRIVSDVDYHPDEGTVVFMPGAVGFGGGNYGKMIEVDEATGAVVFEATITPPTSFYGITFHRVERLLLYQ